MHTRLALLLALLVGCLFGAAPAPAAPGLFVGAVEDAPKQPDRVVAQAKIALAQLAGFDTIRMTAFWLPGRLVPSGNDLLVLQNAAGAAQLAGLRVIVSVSSPGSRTTPLTSRARGQFAAYTVALAQALPGVTDFIIGNEPNLNRFWLPQFTRKGKNAAAPAYELLLAKTYDALKSYSPEINVIGGAVSPRGADNPRSKRQTHSPTTFIPDLGRAYRATKRKRPIMDAFAFHPYMEYSRTPPTFRHPRSTTIGIADYGKLVKLLGKAFDGTAQRGSTLPIVYDEFGVQSTIPSSKRRVYRNLRAPAGRDTVAESVQASYYRQALTIAYCAPNVVGMLIFHVSDEADLDRWQSGIYYADDTPKSSRNVVRTSAEAARGQTLASCRPAKAPLRVERLEFPEPTSYPSANTRWSLGLECAQPCRYLASLVRIGDGYEALSTSGEAPGGQAWTVSLPEQPVTAGSYRLTARVYATGKLGSAVVRTSQPFTVESAPPPNAAPVPGFTFGPTADGQIVAFDGSPSRDPDGEAIATYAWAFGDGSTASSSSAAITHPYALPGPYTVTLTVTDARGSSATLARMIDVPLLSVR